MFFDLNFATLFLSLGVDFQENTETRVSLIFIEGH